MTNYNPGQNILPYFKIAVKRKESSFCPETVENKNRNSLEITVTCEQRFPSESHCYEKLKIYNLGIKSNNSGK